MRSLQNTPLYPIGIVSDLIGVNPETIRSWEKAGLIPPSQRRSGKRFYSQKELKRLQFVRGLAREGLSIRAMLYYLQIYPCWKAVDCSDCLHNSDQNSSSKPCWQEEGTFCRVANMENPCANCSVGDKEEKHEILVSEKEAEDARIQ